MPSFYSALRWLLTGRVSDIFSLRKFLVARPSFLLGSSICYLVVRSC